MATFYFDIYLNYLDGQADDAEKEVRDGEAREKNVGRALHLPEAEDCPQDHRVAEDAEQKCQAENCRERSIDTVSNLVCWSCLVNKLEPWHDVYIIQQ